MSGGATFERVYHVLKEQIGSARYAAGAHLEPATLSLELHASVTPVRDALHQLVGEGLVEVPRGEGFRIPLVSELALRHLYRWNAAVLDLAARAKPAVGAPAPTAEEPHDDLLATTEWLFLAIAEWTGNPEHVACIARLNERLRPARRAEEALLPGVRTELAEMVELVADGPSASLRRRLAIFHRRRARLVDRTVAALIAPRESGP